MTRSFTPLVLFELVLTITRLSTVNCACSFGEDEFNGNCYSLSLNKLNWLSAERQCQTAGGHLTSVRNAVEASYLQGLMNDADINMDDAWSGGNNLDGGSWEQSDGTAPFFCTWNPGYPHNSTDEDANCIALDIARAHCSNRACSLVKHYICKFSSVQTTSAPTTPPVTPCPTGYMIWRNACYKATVNVDHVNWQEAEAMCARDEGAHLVSIHSAEENDLVNGLVANLTGENSPCGTMLRTQAWIGLYDPSNSSQTFQWSDGSVVDYTRWNPGEPNNACLHDEFCVELHPKGDGNWNDRSCVIANAGYVCKKPMQ